MEPACIRHSDLPGASRLFVDFSYHFDRVARFYRYDPHNFESFGTAAREIDYPDSRRAAIVHARRQLGDSLKTPALSVTTLSAPRPQASSMIATDSPENRAVNRS